MADTLEKQNLSKQFLYTWWKCFAKTLRNIKPTDFIKHSINLKPKVCSSYLKISHYTEKKRQFCDRIFLKIEETGIITRASSDWGCQSRFLSEKKRSKEPRIVYNYIPLNSQTIKLQLPMHHIEKVVNTIIWPQHRWFFVMDASNGYWSVRIRFDYE